MIHVYPLSPVRDRAHTEPGTYVTHLRHDKCHLCQEGICTQRLIDGDGMLYPQTETVVVHGVLSQ